MQTPLSLDDLADAESGDLSLALLPPKAGTGTVRRRTKRQVNRLKALLPGGVPRYVRIYDDGQSWERYTVVFTGHYQGKLWKDGKTTELRPGYQGRLEHFRRPSRFLYLGLTEGGSMTSGEHDRLIDANRWGFPPAMGRKNHLGRRIPFTALPEDCRKLVLRDYCELWGLEVQS